MAYYVTNNKPRLIMGFVPGVTVVADDRYEELNGISGKDLTCPQFFFRDQVKLKHLVVAKSNSKVASGDPIELVARMNVDEAIKYCTDCGDARELKIIADKDKRAKVKAAAKAKLEDISSRN
tara:strand:- start:2137 stop:2502 length:366 start_codon:yes stop_codon:yes gene_type:complete